VIYIEYMMKKRKGRNIVAKGKKQNCPQAG
jgi:uncharacterized protein (DUF169 family)